MAHIENYKSHILFFFVLFCFALALAIYEILALDIFDLETVSQGHGVQLSQWRS